VGQDTFGVQYWPPNTLYDLDGIPVKTQRAGVDRTRYTGGFFLFRVGQDTFAVQRFIPERIRAFYLFPQDTAGVQGVFPGGYYLFGTPQDTAGAGVDRTRYTGGFFLYRMGQDTFGVQYYGQGRRVAAFTSSTRIPQDTFGVQSYGRRELVDYYVPNGTLQDPVHTGAGVDRTRDYTGGYFLYALPQDTTKPAELVDYYVPNGTPQDTTEPASAARINIKPLADRVVVEPAPAEERQIAYNAGVEGAIIVERRGNVLVVGNFTPTHVGLPIPVPESISADVRRGTQGEIVVTFTQLH
jgi:hypothetical protein